ncbi:hypothetical protein [Crossiella sp. NPDC003009]
MTYTTTDKPDGSALPKGATVQQTSNYPLVLDATGVRVELHRVPPRPSGFRPREALRLEMQVGDRRLTWFPRLDEAQTLASELSALVQEQNRAILRSRVSGL